MENDCLFCKIINGEIPSTFIFENETLVMFNDINPKAPVHVLIVPRKHIRSINDLEDEDTGIVSEMILCARDKAKELSIDKSGYKLIFHVEKGGGQEIFHIHLHLIGGWDK
ncbi:MAG: histidine triad nucleotide-binding protein [Desulfobacterales bacterium]|nr:histidine triad nucleotide-binding protein [Desulfobacterales bacterium]